MSIQISIHFIALLNSLQNLASGQLCLVLPLFRAVRRRDIPDIAPEIVLLRSHVHLIHPIKIDGLIITQRVISFLGNYLAIRSIIYKQTKGDAPDAEVMNRVVEEMVQNAIACAGIENVVDEHKSVDLFSDEFIEQLNTVKLPITKFNALLKLLRKAISAYGRTNKVKAIEFDERLRKVVDDYNSRDKLVFTSEVVSDFVNDLSDQLLQILKDLQEDQSSFEKMGISFEEKAFYDILVKVRDDHGFPYADEKCVILAKKIKELVDDKAQFADWATRDDIKNQLNMELTVLLYKNGYPPEWDEEVFEKVMEQAENFKRHSDKG